MKVEIYTEIILTNAKSAYHQLKGIKLPLTKNPQLDIDNRLALSQAKALLFSSIKNIEAKMEQAVDDSFDLLRDAEDMKLETQTSFIKEAL